MNASSGSGEWPSVKGSVGLFVIWNSSFRPYSRLIATQSAVYALSSELDEFGCSRLSVRGAGEGRHARVGIDASHSEAATVQKNSRRAGFARRLNVSRKR